MIEEIKHSIEGLVDNVEDIFWNIDIRQEDRRQKMLRHYKNQLWKANI